MKLMPDVVNYSFVNLIVEMESREQQLATFAEFINETNAYVEEVLASAGWTREYLEKEGREMVFCPFTSEHRMPKDSLEHHIQSCSWRIEGYHELDVPLPETISKDSETSIVLDPSNIASIIRKAKKENDFLTTGDVNLEERPIPKTSNRLISDFTTDERRILYDHIIANTRAPGDVTVADVQLMGDMKKDDVQKPKSKLELLIEQRDAKRRRISYRKKVHTNRKTQTEILREVIQNQMELVEQIIKGECDDETNDRDSMDEGDHQSVSEDVKSEPTEGESVRSFERERKIFREETERRSDKEYWHSHGESSRGSYERRRRDDDRYRSERFHLSSGSRGDQERWRNEKYYSKHSHREDRHKEERGRRRDHEQYDDYAHEGRRDHTSRSYSRSAPEKPRDHHERHHTKPSRDERMASEEEMEEHYHRKHKKSRDSDYGNHGSYHEERRAYDEFSVGESTTTEKRIVTNEVYCSRENVYKSEKHKKKSKKSKKKKSHKHKSKSKSKKKNDSGSVKSRSSSVDTVSDGNESFSA